MKEILHFNNQYPSNKMKQGLKDEKKIIWLYENKLDCKVTQTGFVISQSYPFLEASPAGGGRWRTSVDEGNLYR